MRSNEHNRTQKWVFSYLAFVVFVSLAGAVSWQVIRTVRIYAKSEQMYSFARDIAEFANVKGRLPKSIDEFCQWRVKGDGTPLWDAQETRRRISFRWVSTNATHPGTGRLLEIHDQALKPYENDVNDYIRIRISPEVLEKHMIDSLCSGL